MTRDDHPRPEPFWHAQLAIVGVIALFAGLPEAFSPGPRWLIPAIGVALLVALVVLTPSRANHGPEHLRRRAAMGLTGVLSAANVAALAQLVRRLIDGGGGVTGRTLLLAAAELWLATVLLFAVWYWELDRGGPVERRKPDRRCPDFVFPQMTDDAATHVPAGWLPRFFDYLYLSFTNQTAFSPTDTMPYTRTAKALMLLQSVTSFTTVVLVASRAVNILG